MDCKSKKKPIQLDTGEADKSYRGALHEYADTVLLPSEKDAGRIHAAEKHENHLKEGND